MKGRRTIFKNEKCQMEGRRTIFKDKKCQMEERRTIFKNEKCQMEGRRTIFLTQEGVTAEGGKGWRRMTKQEATPKRNRPRRRKHLGRLYVHAIA